MNILLLMPDGTQRESGGTARKLFQWRLAKYPDLVIENCSSGGLRMDYAMLSRYSIQSTSDQEEYDIFGGRGTACAHQSGSYNHGGI